MSYVSLDSLDKGITVLCWSDPGRGNALSVEMSEEFSDAVLTLRKSPPRVVILTGSGDTFSSGGDNQLMLKQSHVNDPKSRNLLLRNFFASFLSLLKMKIPIVAALNGDAIGPGLFLACACDIRVADERARIGATSLRFGRYPVLGATLTVPRLVGPGYALEIMCGRIMDAREAHKIGLIERLTGSGQALTEARKVARHLLEAAPFSTQILLQRLRPDEADFAAAIRHETESLTQCLGRGDYMEAHQAQLDGRPPRWVPQ